MPLIELTIPAREADISSLKVRRLLPWRERRMVGPFTFLDHMGPAHFDSGGGIDVPPHPHIGLATMTYLFDGDILHRDTLGSRQHITPGDVNLMTAGRGIAHSERTGPETRRQPSSIHGIQSWIALPKEYEEAPPAFLHIASGDIPLVERPGVTLRVAAGEAYGVTSPVPASSPLFYVNVDLDAGGTLELPDNYAERALYLVSGSLRVGGQTIDAPLMPVFSPGKILLEALTPAKLILLGGAPLPEPRYMWWNFVSSSKDRIEQAKADWKAGSFGKIPEDDKEFVPLPEIPKPGNVL